MTSFEAGFIAYTEECGLSKKQASHILQRAKDHEGVRELFNSVKVATATAELENLDTVHNLAHQDLIDREMQRTFQQINS